MKAIDFRKSRFSLLCFSALGLAAGAGVCAAAVDISAVDPLPIAERIFKNECAVEADCLIEWNQGEDFLSLGLGHFIWYPPDRPSVFGESFRAYLQYARDAGEALPAWLDQTPLPACPWSSREQFLGDKDSVFYKDLVEFLGRTKQRQAEYMMGNTRRSLEQVIEAAPQEQRGRISRDISWLVSDSQGLYAVVDYVNFKGSGVRSDERYSEQGWGLLQVLQVMPDAPGPKGTLAEFVRAAKEILQRRVSNSPLERNEARWLAGWLRRLDTYGGVR